MHLFLDICQGIGLACAVGVRPFLPALLAGGLAAANAGVDFDHTKYAFLESAGFLILLGLCALGLLLLERYLRRGDAVDRTLGPALGAGGVALGMLLFAGSLADDRYTAWPGLLGGAVCALLAFLAISSLLVRTRARLDDDAAAALPVYAEGLGLLTAGLSVALPPLGLVALALFAALLVTGRRRADQKYAGLRILR